MLVSNKRPTWGRDNSVWPGLAPLQEKFGLRLQIWEAGNIQDSPNLQANRALKRIKKSISPTLIRYRPWEATGSPVFSARQSVDPFLLDIN